MKNVVSTNFNLVFLSIIGNNLSWIYVFKSFFIRAE
jgi:hypothetical protein